MFMAYEGPYVPVEVDRADRHLEKSRRFRSNASSTAMNGLLVLLAWCGGAALLFGAAENDAVLGGVARYIEETPEVAAAKLTTAANAMAWIGAGLALLWTIAAASNSKNSYDSARRAEGAAY